ncbi:MAG: hypothetical protein ACXVXP_00535 [Mycobacteriaceae bacterium]
MTDATNNSSTPTHSADFWTAWPWTTQIKPQIDQAKSLGVNTIRFFGTQMARLTQYSSYGSRLGDQTYFNRWDQLLSYVRAQGMYIYPCIGGSDWGWADFASFYNWSPPDTTAGYQAVYAEMAQHLRLFQAYLDIVIGVDLNNEAAGWAVGNGSQGRRGTALYSNLKSAAGPIPLTISSSMNAIPNPSGQNANGQWIANFTNTLDFVDIHLYCDPTPAQIDAVLSYYNLPTLMGEFGQNVAAGASARQSRYNNILACATNVTSGRQAAGSMVWSMWDQDTVSSNQWGLADRSGNLHSDVQSVFQSFPS